MDKSDSKAVDLTRRGFLRAAGGAGVLGALAAVAGEGAPVQAAAPEPAPAPPAVQRGYHVTPHILTYYRTAAYW